MWLLLALISIIVMFCTGGIEESAWLLYLSLALVGLQYLSMITGKMDDILKKLERIRRGI